VQPTQLEVQKNIYQLLISSRPAYRFRKKSFIFSWNRIFITIKIEFEFQNIVFEKNLKYYKKVKEIILDIKMIHI